MRKFLLPLLLTSLFATPAFASSESGCVSSFKLFFSGFTGCDSVGFLSPGNDTRINLVFMMADAKKQTLRTLPHGPDVYPKPSVFNPTDWVGFSTALTPEVSSSETVTGEGSICVSDAKGRESFIAAVAAAKLPDAETQPLSESRKNLSCEKAAPALMADGLKGIESAAGKEFLAYLNAVNRFYSSDHVGHSDFAALANSSQPWVKEASLYMNARVLLLAAQAQAFDDYGTLQKDKIDAASVERALEALNAYLKEYPKGAYASSATGLLRRVYWLSGDQASQLETYSQLVASSDVNQASLSVVNEMDFKLPIESFVSSNADVMVLATEQFRQMRAQSDDAGKPLPGMKAEALESLRARFANAPELFDYLLAARAWFVDKDAKLVLQLLADKPLAVDMSYLEFSRRILRAAALDASNDASARQALLEMFPFTQSAYQRNTLELALAIYDERHKNVGALFEANSPVQNLQIRQQLLDYVAGPIILRQVATSSTSPQEERDTALYRLIARDLAQGRFKGFLEDIKLLPEKPVQDADGQPYDRYEEFRWQGSTESYLCPGIVDVAKLLNANANDVRGRLCLGDFFRTQGNGYVTVEDKEELGGMGTIFAGKPLARQDFYIDIMKSSSASKDDRAYALYRAVHCYQPIGNNDCGGTDVPKSQRKAWFNELRRSYGNSVWAKGLSYYW